MQEVLAIATMESFNCSFYLNTYFLTITLVSMGSSLKYEMKLACSMSLGMTSLKFLDELKLILDMN